MGAGIAPCGAEAAKFFGLDGEREFAELGGTDGDGGVGVAVVVDIDSGEDERRGELKIGVVGFWIGESKCKGAEFAVGSGNFPIAFAPIDEAGGILAYEGRSGGKMGIVEGDIGGRDEIALTLNVDVAGSGVTDGEGVSGVVEGVALLVEVFAASDGFSADGYGVGDKIQAQNIGGVGVERGIGDRAGAVGDFCDRRERAEQMGFIDGGPFGDCPEGVHHAARAIGEFVGEPPLGAVGSMSDSGKALEIRDPIVGAIGGFFVSGVAGLRVVEGFDGGKTGAVAVAALRGKIAAEFVAVTLLGGDGCAGVDVFGPLLGGLNPFDQFSGMITPLGIFFRMQ